MDFRILGPLEVRDGHDLLDLGGARQQVVLAILLLSANRVVSLDRLIDALYGEDPPATARSQAQISVSAVRRLLAGRGAASVIETRQQGYVITVDSQRLDHLRYRDLMEKARAAGQEGNADQSVTFYREALRLWQGDALTGIDSDAVRVAASHLDEHRLTCNEERIAVELSLGRHRELAPELAEFVSQYPLRERLHEQYMLSLYRCGRTADALQAYQDVRAILVEELGIEPGEQLRDLERAILNADPALDGERPAASVRADGAPPAEQPWRAPQMLPADIADFTGRGKLLADIGQHLAPAEGEPAGAAARHAVPIVAVSGQGGAGKTCLVVHAAHASAGDFPDGQLFADLHGSTDAVTAMTVLDRFLRALGVSGSQVPETLDERAETYRALLAGRRVLVVLDNAASEAQVSPLLPGSPTAAVIMTSRGKLAGLPGAFHVDIPVFNTESSVDLLSRIVGAGRVGSEPGAAAEIAELCGHLPLALRIAGARLSSRQHWTMEQFAGRLSDEARRLDELRYGDMAVRATISLSCEGISPDARRLLRRLAILEASSYSEWAAAALLDAPGYEAQDLLDELIGAQVVTVDTDGRPGQFRLHDLVRLYARERLAAEEPAADRRAALERVLGALLALADEARRGPQIGAYLRIGGGAPRWAVPKRMLLGVAADPIGWYERERASLLSGVRQAASAGLTGLCWELALSAATFYEAQYYLDDWRESHEVALAAVREAGDVRGQAAMLYATGTLCLAEQRYDRARQYLAEAAEIFTGTGDDQALALVLQHVAFTDRMVGRLDDATVNYERALALCTDGGDRAGAAFALHNLAGVKLARHDIPAAVSLLSRALKLSQDAGTTRLEAQVLHRMGEAYLMAEDAAAAAATFTRVLDAVREARDRVGEAYALIGLGAARLRQADLAGAGAELGQARELGRALGDRLIEGRALLGQGELALASADPATAADHARQAEGIFRAIGTWHVGQASDLLRRVTAGAGPQSAGVTPTATVAE
ncbi:MAG: transcriptional regulator, family [Actinomycetia bacterium]|nr:transcriptional regulator, family [Actinomycetes bacterium]